MKTRALIKKQDRQAKENWKLLKEGKLEMPQDLKDHMEGQNISEMAENRARSILGVDRLNDLEAKIMAEYEDPTERPAIEAGEFANMILDYEAKVKNDTSEKNELEETVHKSLDVFLSEDPDSSILNVNYDFRRDKAVTLDEFRKTSSQLNPERSFGRSVESELNPMKADYYEWLEEENRREKLVRKGHEVDAEEVLKDERRHVPVKKYNRNASGKKVHPKEIESDKIELSDNNVTEEGQIYRKGDSYYDHRGEFLYRIPTETM